MCNFPNPDRTPCDFVALDDTFIEVGPDGAGSYKYRIAGFLSARRYHNAASAWFDARRIQHVVDSDYIEPVDAEFSRVPVRS